MNIYDSIADRLKMPLAAAREQNARGKRVIGYLSDDIPVELILASDALPLRLSAPPQETPLADPYLESSFGPAARSFLQWWLSGELDFLEAVVFPRSNDTAQRLYYYVCELQRRGVRHGPRSLIYDLARVNRDASRQHTLAATQKLGGELGVSLARLDAAVSRLQQRTALLNALTSLRVQEPALSGTDALRIWRSLQYDWTEEFERSVQGAMATLPRLASAPRVIVAGSTPPDERFHAAIEQAGANVVDEFFDEAPAHAALRWSAPHKDLTAIADGYRTARNTAPCLLENPDLLVERARIAGAVAVVLWLVEQDEGIVWEVPRQLDKLKNAGIRTLCLTRQHWNADADCLNAVAAFARSLSVSS
jgi:benzoyl-CoA reductase/2-hydroxyglutaryl-CoA dehydratase subunit BcrC/BadD/HgdB